MRMLHNFHYDDLAHLVGVTTRTIRRDLEALEQSGFPLYKEEKDEAADGRVRWKLLNDAFRNLAAGLTWTELSALFFGRTLVSTLVPGPFGDELDRGFEKLTQGMAPKTVEYLRALETVIGTKADPQRRQEVPEHQKIVARALDAIVRHRQAQMTYFSTASQRTKTYIVHPYRLAYAQGGLYLMAFVPEYGEMRTFATERIEALSPLEEGFEPQESLSEEVFPDSLGVFSGTPELIEIDFAPSVAAYVQARTWHPSQHTVLRDDGRLRMQISVCRDQALRSWILGFGASACVVSPADLRDDIAAELDRATLAYHAPPASA